jgi:hypothetical protein
MSNSLFSKPIIHKSKNVKDYGLGKNHKVNVESSIVMPILAESIYKNALSSIRELYNNEKTSCYKGKKVGLKNQHIEITINTETRDLTIQGFNSIGISDDVFRNIILNVGVSGNNDKDSIGMFGLGLYSYSILSENCIITTNSFDDKKIKSYLGKSALNFEEIEAQESLKEYGTKFYLNVKDNIDFTDIRDRIEAVVKFSDIPTKLIIDDVDIPLIQYDDIFDYFNKAINHSWTFSESIVYNFVKTDDYDIIYYEVSSQNNSRMYNRYDDSLLLLLNTPIEFHHYTSNFSYIINIKNEKLFEPHISRDFFSDKIKDLISNTISDNFIEFEGINKTHDDLKSWYDDKLKWFNFSFKGNDDDKINSWHLKCKNPKKPRVKRDISLEYLLTDKIPSKLYYSFTWNKRLYEELKKKNELIVFLRNNTYSNYSKYFDKIGFKEYKIKNKDVISKSKTKNLKVKLTKSFKFHSRNSIDNEPSDIVIKCQDLNADKYTLKYSNFNSNVCLISNNADYDKAITKDDIIKILNKTVFVTSKGLKDIKFIEDNFKDIEFYCNNQPDYYGRNEKTVINQKGLMLYDDQIILSANSDLLVYLALTYNTPLTIEVYTYTNLKYFQSIFNNDKLNILESIANKNDKSDFYENMKYLSDNVK